MALAGKGCRVILACRNLEKGAAARNEILQENAGAEVYVVFLDLLDLDSVRAFSDYVMDQFDSLHYLINNAGVMALPPGISSDGYEVQLQTNHLGHFLLTKLLWKRLVETEGMSRVVQSSCMAHWVQNPVFNSDKYPDSKSSLLGLLQRIPPGLGHDPADQWLRYGVTKLANLLFMRELHRKIDEKKLSDKIISVAAHGGLAATSLQVSSQHYLPYSWRRQLERNGQSAADASLPLLMAIVSKDVLNGDFLGPSGEGEFTGVPTKVELKGFADNEDQAEDLWDHSEDCVKEVFNI
jgi:NAD(P)-dependent dehydrogenase (short-subunit alcohol dehydrogenase family)